jgi:hypothetical protein
MRTWFVENNVAYSDPPTLFLMVFPFFFQGFGLFD